MRTAYAGAFTRRHRTRRVALTGLTAVGELRQLVDHRLRPVNLPPDGVVLIMPLLSSWWRWRHLPQRAVPTSGVYMW
jgi:hypothetical protein